MRYIIKAFIPFNAITNVIEKKEWQKNELGWIKKWTYRNFSSLNNAYQSMQLMLGPGICDSFLFVVEESIEY